jgi:hypothetical protein
MKPALAIVALLAGACSFSANELPTGDGGPGDGPSTSDAGGCEVTIAINPANPAAGDHVHASAVVTGVQGVPTYAWTLDGSASTAYEAPDDSAIGFDVPAPGTHFITVDLSDTTTSCPEGQLQFDVTAGSGSDALYRLRVVAPSDTAPPFETELVVHADTPTLRDVALDPGESITGTIANGAAGVPAYIEFVPASGPPIEAYATATGTFTARVALVAYQVIVEPEVGGLAPRVFGWTYGMPTSFALDAGTTITGTVLGPSNAGLAGAQVQLASGDLPSTIATTAADGSFTALATFTSGSQVAVTVVPPSTSGLARLAATSAFDLSQPLQIAYGAATPCDLGGDSVQRGGAGLGSAQVTIVGAMTGAGTIGGIAATGSIVATATANASGVLPSLTVPRASGLSAVVQVTPSDLAVSAIDTTACTAQPIAAPAELVTTSSVMLGNAALAGVRVEATPAGALAAATLTPVDATSGSDGSLTISLASGGSYVVRIADPRAAPYTADSIAPTIELAQGLAITGTVSLDGGAVVPGAAVELLCASCTGVDADRPIAQTATDVQGNFQLTVADPGSM